ncbi:putative T6SS immunity periplasmic lipoprotein [Serratia nevei]|uniref:putative T6SS immunity periplasmic lipoprotein n=1 Tax=Serratia nevei TaxID=2703794 RepID=UPI003F77222D
MMITTRGSFRRLTLGEITLSRSFYTLIMMMLLSGCILEKQRFYAADITLRGNDLCFSLPQTYPTQSGRVSLVSIAIEQRLDSQTHELWRRSTLPLNPVEMITPGQCIPYSFKAFESNGLYTVAISTVDPQDADSKRFWQRSFSLKISDGKILQVIASAEQ